MKKILTILSVCGFSAAVFAQGTINWAAPTSNFIGQTNGTVYSGFVTSQGSPIGGTSGNTLGAASGLYYYALLTSTGLATAPTSLSAFTGTLGTAWLNTGLQMTNAASNNGRVSPVGGVVVNAAAANWANVDGTTSQNALMVGWSANLGTTWAAALANLNNWATVGSGIVGNAFFGVGSSVGTFALTTANPGATVLGVNPSQINDSAINPLSMQLLYVTPVPEPATIALAGLGGLALLALRRKK